MILRSESLVKKYKARVVANNVSVHVEQGEIVGLLGPNGAGKTTTFYMIVGLVKPNEGKIFLDDQEITDLPMYERARKGIGYLAQEASVFRTLTVEENILSVLQMTKMTKTQQRDKVEEMLEEFSLGHVRKNLGMVLSGGERRRTEIARALAVDPKFVLLDEPFAGVDPIAVEEIQTIVAKLKKKNIGILITDHNVNETLSITDRAYLLFEGKILRAGTAEELAADEMVRKVYLGKYFELKRKDDILEKEMQQALPTHTFKDLISLALVNSILRALLKSRMTQIDAFRKDPFGTQEQLFKNLIERGANTDGGIKHQYSSIRNIEDYKKVPVSTYEQLFPYIERIMKGEQNVLWDSEISWFSKSSGTTNARSKFIPVSKEALKETHYKGGKDTLSCYFTNNPESEAFTGKSLGIGGSYAENPYTGALNCGDVSAIIIGNLPKWAEFGRTPSMEIALMNEWESKIEKMAAMVSKDNVTNISAVPTWTVVLFEKILEVTGKRNMLEVWPDFQVFFHGGVAFHPYEEIFRRFFPGDQVKYYETYNASEGFFAFQDQQEPGELLLALDNGVYYEFIPVEEFDNENPKTVRLDEVVLGQNYALLITTNAGLWRYKIGDTIRFTSLSPFRIMITGRTKHFINAFGEELVIENAEYAMTKACHETHATLKNFTAAPVFFTEKSKAAHEWVVEFVDAPGNLEEFITILDNALKEVNSDYDAKRYKDMALQRPILHSVKEGTFYNWLKGKGKIGAQIKVPRLSNTREYVEEILATV